MRLPQGGSQLTRCRSSLGDKRVSFCCGSTLFCFSFSDRVSGSLVWSRTLFLLRMTLKSPSSYFHLPGTSKTDTRPLQCLLWTLGIPDCLPSTKPSPHPLTPPVGVKPVTTGSTGGDGKQRSDSLRKASGLKREHLPCTHDFKAMGMAGVVRKCSSRCAAYKVYLVQTPWPLWTPGCSPLSKQNGALKMAFRVEALARQD